MSRLWTPKPQFCGGRAYYKALSLCTYGLLCGFLLSSCGQSMPAGYPGSTESTVSSGTLEPLVTPPNPNDRPPAPGMTGAPKAADGIPALQAKGMNTNLFSQKMSAEADRLDRLENAVQELRNDFDAVSPAISRLVAIESDIQDLIKQLEVMTGRAPAPSEFPPIEEMALEEPVPPAAADAPPAPQNILPSEVTSTEPLPPQAPTTAQEAPVVTPPAVTAPSTATTPPSAPAQPVAVSTGTAVMDMRVGEHPGKTRIVLDVRGKATFTTDLDKQEKILVIEIPEAGWNAAAQRSFAQSPMISSYRVEKLGETGTMLVVQLKQTATVSYKGSMNDPATGGLRLIIDLTPTP